MEECLDVLNTAGVEEIHDEVINLLCTLKLRDVYL